jgi:hypothetical protein
MHDTVSSWFCVQTQFGNFSSGQQTAASMSPHGHSTNGNLFLIQ